MLSIQTHELTKRFDSLIAVNRLTFGVKEGEIFGLVGPDASGKTTTLRMLCGILSPDEGEGKVAGFDIQKEREQLKDRIGYLPQRFGLYGDLTVLENINFYADLYQVPKKKRGERIFRLLQFAKLDPFIKRRAQDLSGGMKQKLGLICALIHTPQILLLDEPTTGVDPLSRRDFWVILYELLKEGVTILFSTSYLDEAERCNRVGLLYEGDLLIAESPSAIKNNLRGSILELRLEDPPRGMKILKEVPEIQSTVLTGDKIHIWAEDPDKGKKILKDIFKDKKMEILSLVEIRPSLEDVFVSMVRERKK
ncbi:MAG: ABC transporter ATP-binding protein [Thermodesulfobacteriota bacterium]